VTEQPGIFVTGTAMGPMDIVDSIISASAAASEASAYIRGAEGLRAMGPEARTSMEAVHA
jgi:heterodisulfide reductase subunit A-like polyferredoxin